MKKKIIIKLVIIVSVIINILIFSNIVYAAGSAENWINKIDETTVDITTEKTAIGKILGIALGAVKIISVGIAIIMLTYLSIKYMSAAPSERANIKTSMITFGIGCLLIFGAAEILDKVADISQGVFN